MPYYKNAKTLKRIVKKLRDAEVLITQKHPNHRFKNTLLYRIDYEVLQNIVDDFYTEQDQRKELEEQKYLEELAKRRERYAKRREQQRKALDFYEHYHDLKPPLPKKNYSQGELVNFWAKGQNVPTSRDKMSLPNGQNVPMSTYTTTHTTKTYTSLEISFQFSRGNIIYRDSRIDSNNINMSYKGFKKDFFSIQLNNNFRHPPFFVQSIAKPRTWEGDNSLVLI